MAHGWAKLSRGPAGFAALIHQLGLPAPLFTAWAVTLLELAGGLAIFAGVFVAEASVPLIVTMLFAMFKVHLRYGFSSIRTVGLTPDGPRFAPPGYEINVLYIAALTALIIGGSGALSWDARRARDRVSSTRRWTADAQLRIARPVTSLERSAEMYRRGLGVEEIGRFENHDGFDGVMLGAPGARYHLELTRRRSHPLVPTPTAEDLIVVYVPARPEWEIACESMIAAGFVRVDSFNPHWEERGRTFQDPDGYRFVVQNRTWNFLRGRKDV